MSTVANRTFAFDPDTLKILENYARINPHIFIDEGDLILTKDAEGTIYSEYQTPQEIPGQIALADLPGFLAVASLLEKPEVTIDGDNRRLIVRDTASKRRLTYRMASPEILSIPRSRIKQFDTICDFEITKKHIEEITKAANVLGIDEICFVANAGESIILQTSHPKNEDMIYAIDLGVYCEHDMRMVIQRSQFNLVKGDYGVKFGVQDGNPLFAKFEHRQINLGYWLGLDSKFSYLKGS